MRHVLLALAGTACFALGGCLGDDDDSPADPDGLAIECPNPDDARSAGYDLGTNPDGYPSPRAAVARFLRLERSGLNADDFVRLDDSSSPTSAARFEYSDGSARLVQLSLRKLDRGWLVIAYDYCQGTL